MSWLARHNIFVYQNYLLYAITFFIPLFPKIVPLFIILFGALSLFAIVKGYSRAEMSEVSVLLIIFYGLHVSGLIFTENLDRGFFDLEVKLSLLVFPLVFVGFKFLNTTNFNNTLRLFLYGTMAQALISLAQSSYKVLIMDMPYYHFLTSRYSFMLHPSYLALYLIFSMLILAYLEWPLIKSANLRRTLLNIGIMIFLSICVMLCGSKIGFIMWVVIAMMLTILLVREARRKWVPIVGLVVVCSILGGVFQAAPALNNRILNVLRVAQESKVSPDAAESTAVRVLVYVSSWEIVSSQRWYGQGTGDFQDELDAVYTEKGYVKAKERHFNAHNVFLQSWISLGIPGLVTIIGIFIVMLQQAFKTREWIYIGFTTLFFLISMTESSLNVQAGVVFFSFFTVLFSRRALSSPQTQQAALAAKGEDQNSDVH